MSEKEGCRISFSFSGDWSIAGVSERLPQLNEWLETLGIASGNSTSQSVSERTVPEIDLSGIETLDLCGCQLIAAFLNFLRQRNFPPSIQTIPDHLREQIHRFGLESAFVAS